MYTFQGMFLWEDVPSFELHMIFMLNFVLIAYFDIKFYFNRIFRFSTLQFSTILIHYFIIISTFQILKKEIGVRMIAQIDSKNRIFTESYEIIYESVQLICWLLRVILHRIEYSIFIKYYAATKIQWRRIFHFIVLSSYWCYLQFFIDHICVLSTIFIPVNYLKEQMKSFLRKFAFFRN